MYTFNSRVRYSEVTKEQTLDLYSILNYFQDCSNFQSADLGVGVQYLTEHQRAWLLSSWQIELLRAPRLFESISVGTWPYDFKGLYGYRNFVLYNESRGHEVAACANSIWFLIDTQTGRPTRIMPEDSAPYILEPPYPMEYAPRKIALPEGSSSPQPKASVCGIPAQTADCAAARKTDACPQASDSAAPVCPPVTVTKTFLDTNNHVNNGQYVRLAEACLPEDFAIHSMRAEYRRAAVLGDVICPAVLSSGPKHYYVSLNNTDGNAYAVVEFIAK